MKSRLNLLAGFPMGLFSASVIFNILFLSTSDPNFSTVAHFMIVSGLIGGFLAAVVGVVDWLGLPHFTVGELACRLGVTLDARANISARACLEMLTQGAWSSSIF